MIRPARVMLAVLIPLLGAARLHSQVTQPDTIPAPPAQQGPAAAAQGPLLDAPVSRTGYLLGPGDVVNVSIFGDLNLVYTLPVTPEGSVVVPTVGVVRVLGLNLNEAQGRVRDAVLRFYRNVDVNVGLAQVRSFKVFVLGVVEQPGVRVATAATRVSEILPPVNGVVRRNVLLRRASGDSVRVDLVRFIQTGDLAANPTLREGDALIIPSMDETVQMFGRVFFPGTYEYRPGETLAEFLSVANGGGGFPSNAADTVRLSRFADNGQRRVAVLSRAEALGATGRSLRMQPQDAVYVSAVSNYRVQRTATVDGQVARPGSYPVRPDTTTVRELVAMAGGFTPTASLVDATLRRQTQSRTANGFRDLQGLPPELLTREERELLRVRAQGDQSNVVVDFQQLFAAGQNAYDQTVRDGDVLTVPQQRNDISVLGAVRTPGIVPFTPGQGVATHVARAGGYTRLADRRHVSVLRPTQGTPLDLRDVSELRPGDTVIVPFRERLTLIQRIGALNAVVGTLSGVALTILAVGQIF